MTKKLGRIDKILAGALLQMGELKRMATRLEKEHKTKIVFAEMCLVAENGEIVYRAWNIPETKKFMPKVFDTFRGLGLGTYDEMLDNLCQALPFGMFAHPKGKESGQE